MAQIGVFVGFSQNDSSGNPSNPANDRINAFKNALLAAGVPASAVNPPVFVRTGPWDPLPVDYNGPAGKVLHPAGSPAPAATFSSCYLTTNALIALAPATTPLIYAGLFNWNTASSQPPHDYTFGQRNVTGWVTHEFTTPCSQWWSYLKQVAAVTSAYVIYESTTQAGQEQLNIIKNSAAGVTVNSLDLAHFSPFTPTALDQKIGALPSGTGVIVTTGALLASIGFDIVTSCNNHNKPAIYPNDLYVKYGGLMSYGCANLLGLYTQAGSYLAQVINNLRAPLQAPSINTTFGLAFNTTTAANLNITIPAALLKGAKIYT
jgi:ABC-type uncharacterized transport system substrate-binding protein